MVRVLVAISAISAAIVLVLVASKAASDGMVLNAPNDAFVVIVLALVASNAALAVTVR